MLIGKFTRRLVTAAVMAAALAAPATAQEPDTSVYELRTYTAAPGTLQTLVDNFRDTVIPLFEKHGMTSVAYWTPVDAADERIIYVLNYDTRDARDAAWGAFAADPEFRAMMDDRNARNFMPVKVESVLMQATDYSPVVVPDTGAPRVYEMRTYPANEGRLDALNTRFRDHTLGFFDKYGMTNVMYFTVLPDQDMSSNNLIYFLAYPSEAARAEAWAGFAADPEWAAVAQASEADGPLLSGPPGSVLLNPTPYSPLQ